MPKPKLTKTEDTIARITSADIVLRVHMGTYMETEKLIDRIELLDELTAALNELLDACKKSGVRP